MLLRLFGVTTVQTVTYFKRYPTDKLVIKVTVGGRLPIVIRIRLHLRISGA